MAAVAGDCIGKREVGKHEGEHKLAVAAAACHPAGGARCIAGAEPFEIADAAAGTRNRGEAEDGDVVLTGMEPVTAGEVSS